MEQKYIVAFEIGSAYIKGAIATTVPGAPGRVNILAVETEHLVDKVRYGCVENPGDVAACVTSICHKLQAAPGVSPRSIKEVYVGLSGRSLASYPHEVTRDFHAEIEITRRTIDDLMQQAAARAIAEREVVAIEPGSFSVDSQTTHDPVGMFGHILSAQVSLVACKPRMRNNIKRVFNERCALNIAGYVVTPLAMGTQLLTVEERRLGVMLVDFGAETTTVAIYRAGALVYLATIPMGSRNITRDITSLNCLEERAEEIKKAVGNAMPPEPGVAPLVTDGLDNSEINNIIAARADEIISNIYEQIAYAGLKPQQLPEGVVVTGGGAALRGFTELLAKQTQLKTRAASLGPGVTVVGHGINANNALDVISIITEAAMTDPVECTMMPPSSVMEHHAEVSVNDAITPSGNQDDEDEHRIGRMEDEDDSILSDQGDDDEIETVTVKKGKTTDDKKESKKTGRKVDTKSEPGDASDARSKNFWARLSQSINNMMKEDSDFEN